MGATTPSISPIVSGLTEVASVKDTNNLVSRMAEASEMSQDPEVVKEVYKYGKTPIAYIPTKAMAQKPATPGLMDFIRQSTTVKEVEKLVARGEAEYKNAHPGTVRKWKKLAAKRIAALEAKPTKRLKKVKTA